MNKKIISIIAIVLLLVVCTFGGYYLGTMKNNSQLADVNDGDNQETNNAITQYTSSDLESIIDTYLESLVNKNSLEELTNQERLYLLLSLYQEQTSDNMYDTLTSISISDLENIHQNSIIKDLDITYTDIYYKTSAYFSSDSSSNRIVFFQYNKEENSYTCTGYGSGVKFLASIMYKELISFEEIDNEYTIKYKYVFGNNSGDGPTPYTLYYSGIDAYNEKNAFKVFDYEDCENDGLDCKTPAVTYIKDNYDSIKDKLSTYTYTFKVDEDNQLVLTSFKVE